MWNWFNLAQDENWAKSAFLAKTKTKDETTDFEGIVRSGFKQFFGFLFLILGFFRSVDSNSFDYKESGQAINDSANSEFYPLSSVYLWFCLIWTQSLFDQESSKIVIVPNHFFSQCFFYVTNYKLQTCRLMPGFTFTYLLTQEWGKMGHVSKSQVNTGWKSRKRGLCRFLQNSY